MARLPLALLVFLPLLALGCPAGTDGTAGDGGGDTTGDGDGDGDSDGGVGDGDGDGDALLSPGAACDCDDECPGTDDNPGACVFGICMQEATAACAEAGSQGECEDGSRCWGLSGMDVGLCWPDCDAHNCDGTCDSDGSCVPDDSSTCDYTCTELCTEPECLEDSDCGDGLICEDDACVIDLGEPPAGPAPACDDVPSWECDGDEAYCGEVIQFEPLEGDGWINYPLNGETAANQYRSFARRDMVHLIQYVTSKVHCLTGGWPGNGGQLGLGDMSEANGDIPGTSVGQPGHPDGTHEDGYDMDIAYYQAGTADNILRPVCEHAEGGQDVYHCTGAPTLLDPWRTALFLGLLHDTPQLRVIGVDGRIGPLMLQAIPQLCQQGFISGPQCQQVALAYEEEDEGLGWYRFHHHHLHVSLTTRANAGFAAPGPLPDLARACLIPGCGEVPLLDDPRVHLDYGPPLSTPSAVSKLR